MKTATVTWASYNNYGTLLQAYALQKAIEQLGYENVIISDREILNERKAKTSINSAEKQLIQAHQDGISARLQRLLTNPGRLSRMLLMRTNREKYDLPYNGSQSACNEFRRSELRILYGQISDSLTALNDQFDAFICGSDQVWSVHDGVFNPYYYLDFVTKKKISYASSLGTDRISPETAQIIKNLLADFSAVSVREGASAKQLSSLAGKEVAWVADPTLLHDRAFWEQFTASVNRQKGKYLLCYFLENKAWYFNYAREIAKKMKLRIVLIPNKWDYLSNEYVIRNGVGPKEFVSLIQHAEYVLTDSYHGSIFSLIFEKDFQYLLRFAADDPKSQNIRIQSLYDYLKINERIVAEHHTSDTPLCMDYTVINEKLNHLRMHSRKYLCDSLQ